MTLAEYLKKHAITITEFAPRIPASVAAVSRYVSGERIPDRNKMPGVVAATNGEVQPNDFFGAPSTEKPEAA